MSNRISGINPDEKPQKPLKTEPKAPSKPFKPIEAIKKVDETELWKQRKQKRGQLASSENENALGAFNPSDENAGLGMAPTEKPIQPPQDAAPRLPGTQIPIAGAAPAVEPEELPQSRGFWSSVDLPDEPPEQPHLTEQRHRESKSKSQTSDRDRDSKESSDLPTPLALHQLQGSSKGKSKGSGKPVAGLQPKPSEELPSSSQTMRRAKEKHLWEPDDETGQKGKASEKKEETAFSRVPDPLPPSILQTSSAALSAASPYLSPEVANLFKHMVGTILFMESTTPGISRTEVFLTSSAFQKSVFFNSTILIEKYSTAPDSFNIRLSGSPEAVKIFNNNIDSLINGFTTAYENRTVKFRVGRIEASYAAERPLFRRKSKSGEKDTESGMGQE